MAIFVVLSEAVLPDLKTKITTFFPNDHYELTPTQWLLSADTIPSSLADQLGTRENGLGGRVIIIQTTGSAAGWHANTAWEWLRQKRGVDG